MQLSFQLCFLLLAISIMVVMSFAQQMANGMFMQIIFKEYPFASWHFACDCIHQKCNKSQAANKILNACKYLGPEPGNIPEDMQPEMPMWHQGHVKVPMGPPGMHGARSMNGAGPMSEEDLDAMRERFKQRGRPSSKIWKLFTKEYTASHERLDDQWSVKEKDALFTKTFFY